MSAQNCEIQPAISDRVATFVPSDTGVTVVDRDGNTLSGFAYWIEKVVFTDATEETRGKGHPDSVPSWLSATLAQSKNADGETEGVTEFTVDESGMPVSVKFVRFGVEITDGATAPVTGFFDYTPAQVNKPGPTQVLAYDMDTQETTAAGTPIVLNDLSGNGRNANFDGSGDFSIQSDPGYGLSGNWLHAYEAGASLSIPVGENEIIIEATIAGEIANSISNRSMFQIGGFDLRIESYENAFQDATPRAVELHEANSEELRFEVDTSVDSIDVICKITPTQASIEVLGQGKSEKSRSAPIFDSGTQELRIEHTSGRPWRLKKLDISIA